MRPSPHDARSELKTRAVRARFFTDAVATTVDGKRHERELAFIDDPSDRIIGKCGRRGGKTEGACVRLLRGASRNRLPYAYITLARENAKTLAWPVLCRLNEEYQLGGTVNQSDLSITWGLNAGVWLRGANDRREIEKLRGHKFAGVVIDEPQSFPAWLKGFLDEILMPTLMDYDGWLAFIGTPPEVWVGEFVRCWDSGKWSNHEWTAFDNPFVDAEKALAKELERRGVGEDDPAIQREYFGVRCDDASKLVYKFGHASHLIGEPQWDHTVLAFDVGWNDSDAIAVLGWQRNSRVVQVIHEEAHPQQIISALGGQLRELWERYRPLAVWGDLGGLGRKAAEEIKARFLVPVEAAEKTRKVEHIRLLNDAMTSGRLLARPDGLFAEDCKRVKRDDKAAQLGEFKIDEQAYHSDICDAVLYGYRACTAYMECDPAPVLPEGEIMKQARIAQMQKRRDQPWWAR